MNKILIVDHDKSIQMFYDDELTQEGYEVVICGDGSQLLDLIENKQPDLIVMEVRLGEHDGLDLLQDIRNTYYNLPVILCTTYSNYKYDIRSIAADYYVVKSSDVNDLKEKIRMGLEGGEQLPSVYANGVRDKETVHIENIWPTL